MTNRQALTAICCLLIVAAIHGEEEGLSLRELNEKFTQTSNVGPPQPAEDHSQFWYDRQFTPVTDWTGLNNDPRFDAAVSARIAANALDVAHDIGVTVLAEEGSNKKAEVFSPLSIYSALSLLLLGASGSTFDELLRLMHFDTDTFLSANPWKIHEDFGLLLEDVARIGANPAHRREQTGWKVHRGPAVPMEVSAVAGGSYRGETLHDYRVSVANGLFVQNGYSLRPDYRSAVFDIYGSNVQMLDFERNATGATEFINGWVNEKTEGKIPKIVGEQLNPATKIVMASALYFNARWEKTFIEGATGPKNFYPNGLDEQPITVEMMGNGGRFPFYDAKEFDCRILGLPYKHNMTTMYIIQPNNSDRQRLRHLQALLTADKIESMIAKMQWETAIVLLPKMQINNQLNLKEVLHKMGVQTLFNVADSDLSLISNDKDAASPDVGIVPAEEVAAVAAAPAPEAFATPMRALRDGEQNDEAFVFPSDSYDNAAAGTQHIPSTRVRRGVVTYKVPSEQKNAPAPLTMKSFILSKRITKTKQTAKKTPGAVLRRARRQVNLSQSIKQLDALRQRLREADTTRSSSTNGLYVDEILHQVDLTVNEKGTEGGAATVTTLFRTGTDVVMRVETPFMFLIRHDETKLPLFYGAVFEPQA